MVYLKLHQTDFSHIFEKDTPASYNNHMIREYIFLNFRISGTVVTIDSSKEVDTKLKSASKLCRLSILYFTAKWCGPCRMMGPVFTKLAVKYPKVVFLKVDIDQFGSIAQAWRVDSVPTFFFVKQGKEVDKVVGGDKIGLERKIKLYTIQE